MYIFSLHNVSSLKDYTQISYPGISLVSAPEVSMHQLDATMIVFQSDHDQQPTQASVKPYSC